MKPAVELAQTVCIDSNCTQAPRPELLLLTDVVEKELELDVVDDDTLVVAVLGSLIASFMHSSCS
jgi:hypothetical protein